MLNLCNRNIHPGILSISGSSGDGVPRNAQFGEGAAGGESMVKMGILQ